MPEPHRRRRFQIHLSTAFVLMFVAGALIWANVRGKYQLGERYVYGWPSHWIMLGPGSIYDYELQCRRLLLDIVVTLAILFTIWFVCERLIRRRSDQKEL